MSPTREESDGCYQFRKSWLMRLIFRDKIFAIWDSRGKYCTGFPSHRARCRRRDHSIFNPTVLVMAW